MTLAAAAVRGAVGSSQTGSGYGIYAEEHQPGRVILRSKTCAMWELAKSRPDLPDDTFCGPHQAFYQQLAHNIDPTLTFRFASTIARGAPCCEWIFQRM
jgi:hypothetical protein